MRGKVLTLCIGACVPEITPAYAGKSGTNTASEATGQDHPRVCGEKLQISRSRKSQRGSPPRMRGKGSPRPAPLRCARITPAYAGKSEPRRLHEHQRKDHPRVCGEKALSPLSLYLVSGSPPRMRGKVSVFLRSEDPNGITPAYAGKRSRTPSPARSRGDHPRVCGEKMSNIVQGISQKGSPPRMRGKVYIDGNFVPVERITPAYAGKRKSRLLFLLHIRDHPRVCGEKTKKIP